MSLAQYANLLILLEIKKMAGEPGFEPGLTESESVGLPLTYSPIADQISEPVKRRGVWLPFLSRSDRLIAVSWAPSNTFAPSIKRQFVE